MKIDKLLLVVLVCICACGKEKFTYPDPDPYIEQKMAFLGNSYVLDSIKPVDKIDSSFDCALGDTLSFQLDADSSCKVVVKPDKKICSPADTSIRFFYFDVDTWAITMPIFSAKDKAWYTEFCEYEFSFSHDVLYVHNYLSMHQECIYQFRRVD